MTDREFGATYDQSTKVVSACVLALLVAVAFLARGAWWAPIFAVAVFALSFAYSPRGYAISGGSFRVKRLAGDVVFPLDRLRFVRYATSADLWGSVRLWGSGGLFGYYGWYWSRALGRARWYVTDRSRAVVLADGEQLVVVSPDDRDGFVAAIGTAEGLRIAGAGSGASAMLIGLVIGGTALGVTAAAMLYSPGRPPVDLTEDSLVIHSRFYGMTLPAAGVDVANVRVVDLENEQGWKPVSRTGGFGNPYYRAGNFRTASGRAVKLFTTGAARLVLLPPSVAEGTPVLLDVANPDAFAARVREAWGR